MEILAKAWAVVAGFLNSNFTAALAGAFAGAMAARAIEGRASARDSLQQELRATNAAIMLAFLICSTAITLKVQFVKGIHDSYTELRRRHAAAKLLRSKGTPPFEFEFDLRDLVMPQFPVDALRAQMYEKVSTVGRPLALTSQIEGSIASLASTMLKRHELIERVRAKGSEDPIIIAQYLGEPYGIGHRSDEFPDSIESLSRSIDDVIFFSQLLVTDLVEHGNTIIAKLDKISKGHGEKVSEANFQTARDQGLLPDDSEYSNWTNGFMKSRTQTPVTAGTKVAT